MQVVLAGYNIDKSLIDSLKANQSATPEVISAAYARISRSVKSISELHLEAQNEINKARSSNESIIFEMGHSSIAEHAVYNIDIIGVSRLLTETIQRSRLASFTEKSQRYVTFNNDFVIPEELNPELKSRYTALMSVLFQEYKLTMDALLAQVSHDFPHLKKREQEGMAKEDARYILPLATQTQLGMTINARSLEAMLRRINSNPSTEAQELAQKLYSTIHELTPSLIRYVKPDSFETQHFHPLASTSASLSSPKVAMINHSTNPDNQVLAALLYSSGEMGYHETIGYVTSLDEPSKQLIYKQLYQDLRSWHKLPRAFELADFTFELQMSESCWAQFKRHRLCTIIRQQHSFTNTHFTPPSLPPNLRERWDSLLAQSCELASTIEEQHPGLGAYALTNSQRVVVLVKMNLRELHHFVRLRSDIHAQWEIRELSQELSKLVKTICPLSSQYLMGKSEFGLQQ